jgi:ribonucleoside-diphosphate reductase alpha chain
MLDELIDHQNYFAPAAANFAKKRRSLGIGITNLAAVFAREGVKYWDKKAPNLAARLMESVSYYLLSASADLAQEKGPCDKYSLTKFSKGVLPIDTYKKEIDEFVTEKLHQDWEALREKIAKTGIRNSTLTALMPCESSAVIQSSTNGIEPPRSLITSKRSKAGIVPSVVPGVEKYGENYTLAFEMPGNEGYLKVVAALQKFVDMSISANLYYNVNKYPNRKVSQNDLIMDILTAYKYGLKTLYYTNTYDGDTQTALNNNKSTAMQAAPVVKQEEEIPMDDSGCAGGACTL